MPTATEALRIEILRSNLRQTRAVPDPDTTRALADGQVRLRVDHFALTSNNITYAAFGDAMKYWQFFPCADSAWGCVPVWGCAVVVESRAEGVAVGERVYAYLPMGSHLVVDAARVSANGFVDAAAHRQELAAVYNQLSTLIIVWLAAIFLAEPVTRRRLAASVLAVLGAALVFQG